jgi:hypothetical protein
MKASGSIGVRVSAISSWASLTACPAANISRWPAS